MIPSEYGRGFGKTLIPRSRRVILLCDFTSVSWGMFYLCHHGTQPSCQPGQKGVALTSSCLWRGFLLPGWSARSSLTRQFWKENLEALITWYLKDAGVTLSGVLLGQRTVIFLYASPGRWKFLDVLWWFPEGENIGTKKRLRS